MASKTTSLITLWETSSSLRRALVRTGLAFIRDNILEELISNTSMHCLNGSSRPIYEMAAGCREEVPLSGQSSMKFGLSCKSLKLSCEPFVKQ